MPLTCSPGPLSTRSVFLHLALGLLATPNLVMPADAADWVEVRAADHFAQAASELGLPLLLGRAVAGPEVEGTGPFIVRTSLAEDGTVSETPQTAKPAPTVDRPLSQPLTVKIEWEGRSIERQTTLRDLDRAGQALALAVALAEGQAYDPGPWPSARVPWPVERRLGQARVRELAGKWSEAQLAFDRAAGVPGGVWWSALDGAARCRPRLRPELAEAAAARGRVAARREDWPEATRAWMSVLKYSPRRGLRWIVPGPFSSWTPAGADGEALYGALGGAGPGPGERTARETTQPRSGLRLVLGPARATLERDDAPFRVVAPELVVQQTPKDLLFRPGRWRAGLDSAPQHVQLVGGHLAAWSSAGVTWLDPSNGRPVGEATGPILAVGPRGAVADRNGEVSLTRPGQELPQWRAKLGPVRAAAVTGERVLLLAEERVRVLRARDGELLFDQVLGERLRILSAHGRLGLLAEGERYVLVDVLGGELIVDRRGPDAVLDGSAQTDGFAVAFASGDVMLFDAQGAPSDRARWQVDLHGLDRRPEHPRLVTVATGSALLGLDDAGRQRNGEGRALLELARIHRARGDDDAALALANAAAAVVFAPIAEAERLRAELLPEGPARSWARSRAESAEALSAPLLPFRALGPPRPAQSQSTTTDAED